MRKSITFLLLLVLCFGLSSSYGGAVMAEDNGMMKESDVQSVTNASCTVSEVGEKGKNSLLLEAKDGGFAGVWLAFEELDDFAVGEKAHVELRVRAEASTVTGYSAIKFVDEASEYIDGVFRVKVWQNLLFDARVYLREGKKCVFLGVKNANDVKVYLGFSTVSKDVYDENNLFGGVKLYMIEPEKNQSESFVFVTTSGKIIVIDGGDYEDKDSLLSVIRTYKNEVDDWYVSHYHCDHVYALIRILNEENIYIRNLYYDFNVSEETLDKYGDEDNHLVKDMAEAVKINAHKIGKIVTPKKGDEFVTDDVKIKVLNDAKFLERANMPNDSTVAYKAETPGKSVLFLGDLGAYGGTLLKDKNDKYFLNEAKTCEVVQLAHHGQSGIDINDYKYLTSMKVALYCAPRWLFDCDSGSGAGSGPWQTLKTREAMRVLKVRYSFASDNGRILLK